MKKPNILLLFPDQARHDTIAEAGFPWMKTPALDRLVREGCLFTRAYTPSPLCMPARYSLITGRSPRAHGFFGIQHEPILDAGLPTLPQVLSDHGWATAAVGKMHFYPPRRHHGFEWMRAMEELPRDRSEDDYALALQERGRGEVQNLHGVRPLLYHEPQASLVPEELHESHWVDEEAIAWMEKVKHRPFFLMCGWIKPHPPWDLPPRWQGAYRGSGLPEPILRSREFPFPAGDNPYYGDGDSPEEKRRIREAYYASVSMVDESIGRILAWLEQEGILDDTIILYASDHGEMLQDKGFYQKTLPYESASRIPLVVRWPQKFTAGSKDDRFADLCDLFPTILDLVGLEGGEDPEPRARRFDGASLVSEATRHRSHQNVSCVSGRDRWSAVREARWKYVYFYNGGTEQLFDLQDDPGETRNLLNGGTYPPAVLSDLRSRVFAYESVHGPAGQTKNGAPIPFPAKALDPASDSNASCKFPAWAHQHFQRFSDEAPKEITERFAREAGLALGSDDPSARIRGMSPGPEWEGRFKEQLKSLGDEGVAGRDLFGE
ncbi:MAG: sulfatase-like hydrolase/transferase [Spirochaetes bacterium]|nr:sulfatase-like hydrolase/transferase [Spirochaetota bacterium]